MQCCAGHHTVGEPGAGTSGVAVASVGIVS
jgi:hypothetical protein